MVYRAMRLAVFWSHLALSAWLFGGTLIECFFPHYVPWHTLLLDVVIASEALVSFRCPLADLEKFLLKKGGQEVYEGAFLRHYVEKYFGWTIPPKAILVSLLVCLLYSVALWFTYSRLGYGLNVLSEPAKFIWPVFVLVVLKYLNVDVLYYCLVSCIFSSSLTSFCNHLFFS